MAAPAPPPARRRLARFAVVVACLLLFALIAGQLLTEGPLTRIDREVMLFLSAHRKPWLTQTMLLVSRLHDTLSMIIIASLLAAWFGWRRRRDWVLALLALPTGMLLNVSLKQLFHRARPTPEQPLAQLTTFSFPSGHAIAATLFYGVLCTLLWRNLRSWPARAAGAAACAAMVVAVCLSRLYLGVHYLSDVLAAVCIGIAWLLIWTGATERYAGRRRQALD